MGEKVALVTGANRGIGLSLCKQLHAAGFHVYGACRNASPELETSGVEILEKCNIADPASCQALRERLSGVALDLLINNAGILRDEKLGELNFDTIEEQFRVNTVGALRVTEALLENLHAGSKIGIITSRMGSIADNTSGGRYGYRISKAALNAASTSLAIDLKPRDIAVGIFHPGLVGTDMIGGHGDITSDEAATRIIGLLAKLNLDNSGTFWHSNGETLPW